MLTCVSSLDLALSMGSIISPLQWVTAKVSRCALETNK